MPFDLKPSRRELLLAGGAAALTLGGLARAVAAGLSTRPDAASVAGQAMTDLYAAAVAAMQDPAINYPPQPQSWTFQAYIHAVPENPFDPANSGGLRTGTAALKKRVDEIYGEPAPGSHPAAWKQAALRCWATCTHGSPYFTTWHRWYLYYFERICRQMCNDPKFQLPYWNYASDIGASLQLPAEFRDPSTRLIFDDRGLGFANPQGSGPQNVAMNNGGYMPYPLIDYGPALGAKVMFPSDTTYSPPTSPDYIKLGLTGRLECAPHDMVHDNVGGWMGNVPSAAGDPVFFLHHCQIDRLYASWEAEAGVDYNWGSTPEQPGEQEWANQAASFADETGKLVLVKLGDAVKTDALGYAYDQLATPPASEPPLLASSTPVLRVLRVRAATIAVALQANEFEVRSGGSSIMLAPNASTAAAPPGQPPLAALRAGGPIVLVLSGLQLLRRPPAPLSVFVNMPDGTAAELNGPYYAGTLNLFNLARGGMAHDGQAMAAPDVRFDVTEVLRRQRARGLWDGRAVKITIGTIGADVAGSTAYVKFTGATLLP